MPVLSWSSGDPDSGDVVAYDIYLGPEATPPLYKKGYSGTSYQPDRLLPLSTYYWKIVARDNHNAETAGPTWSFTTANEAPAIPTKIFPNQSSGIAYGNVYLCWQGSDPDIGDSLTYDIYFGETSDPPLVLSDSSDTVHNLGALNPSSLYYWKIVAKDSHGGITAGPVWSFETSDHAPVVLSGTISSDTTLTAAAGPYFVQSTVTVAAGTTLTLEAGTVIKVGPNALIEIQGTLTAQGTANDPVIITSEKDDRYAGDTNGDGRATLPEKGDWSRLWLSNTEDVSQLSHVHIYFGGANTSYALQINGGTTQISNCVIAQSADRGIYLNSGAAAVVADTVFEDNDGYDVYCNGDFTGSISGSTFNSGLWITGNASFALSANLFNYRDDLPVRLHADTTGTLSDGNTFSGSSVMSYIDVIGGTITRDAVWDAPISFHILGNISILGTDGMDGVTTLTLTPGAEVRVNGRYALEVGANSGDPGALVAQGTAADPIVFTSNKDPQAAGDWYGIRFRNTADDATTIMAHCIVEYAGYGSGGESVFIGSASPTLNHCTIRYSQGSGIEIDAGSPVISNSVFTDIAGYDLYYNNAVGGTVSGCTFNHGMNNTGSGQVVFTGNTVNYDNAFPIRLPVDSVGEFVNNATFVGVDGDSYLEVLGGNLTKDATWTDAIACVLTTNVIIKGTDGVDGITTLTLTPGAEVRVNGRYALEVGANSGDPGALVAQGTAADPIVFTSNKDPQAAGDWYGIRFRNTADDATTIMAHCIVEYAGYGSGGQLVYISDASPTLSHCILSFSQGYGVYIQNDTPEISHCVVSDTNTGIYVYSGTPLIYGNRINGNAFYGLYNRTSPVLIAEENWWGHLSGPYHATTNPDGLGDTVSDYVDYEPWVVDINDMDMDGIPDQWETGYFGDTETIDETTDYDGDGLLDCQEYTYNTAPTDTDTDDDGISDGDEVTAGTDRCEPPRGETR